MTYQPRMAHLFAAVSLLAMAGCATLPASGPYSDSVRNPESATALPYVLVALSGDTIGPLSVARTVSLPGTFTDRRPAPEIRLGVGDLVSVSIFEAAPGGLFTPAQTAGARPGNFVELPAQAVAQTGNISVPYAGLIQASGRTIPQVQQTIEERLRDRAIEPQAVVALREQRSTLVTVAGEVNQAGRFAISLGGQRLLDTIAQAGGSRFPAAESFVTLQRGGRRARVLLNRLVSDPTENIFVRPGDTIYVTRDAPTYVAVGASGQNGLFTIESEAMSLAQATGKAGGLLDDRADPGSVFVYRLEDRAFLEKIGVDTSLYGMDPIPTVYTVDLRDPTGYLMATRFQMRDKDVVFVANAKAVDFVKLISLVRTVLATVRETNATVREFR